jgi:hypothetical protein
MRAPRNFTLTPQMVGQRSSLRAQPAGRLVPVLGFASALATFLLILVIAGDFMGILGTSSRPVAQAPALATEAAVQPAVTALVEEPGIARQAAPSEPESPAATAAEDSANLQAPLAAQMITGTANMSPSLESSAPFTQPEETPALAAMALATDTLSTAMTETLSAKQATGMGGGVITELDEDLPMSSAIFTSEGIMWNATISVTVSPTETLTFPMTVTMTGPGITVMYDAGVGGRSSEEPLMQETPDQTPVQEETASPEESAAPVEMPAPSATEAPEIVALAAATPTASLPEMQTIEPAGAPTQTLSQQLPVTQPEKGGISTLRIIEIILALLALITASAAFVTWWLKKF